jgi:hypothetical protein
LVNVLSRLGRIFLKDVVGMVYAAWLDTEVQSKNWRIIDQQFILVSFDVFPFAVMVIGGNK